MQRKRWAAITAASLIAFVGAGAIYSASRTDDDGAVNSATEVHGHMHHQHGGDEGHLPASNTSNIRLVGKMRVNQDQEGRVADVGIHKNYAYLGAFFEPNCQKGGVYVFDISNPAAPKQINFIRTGNNSYVGEGVQVISIATPQFTGDILIHNNEICDVTQTGAVGGISIVDVTNPKTHKYLARGVGDFTPLNQTGQAGEPVAHTVHSAFGWQAGNKAYAVLVDNEELADLDIMDISDPRNPVLVAEYDLNEPPFNVDQPLLGDVNSFIHDMIVKKIGNTYYMLVSYWDGGYVVLDVTNPLNATYVADSDFADLDPEALQYGFSVKPEGNAHQAEFSKDNKYIVAADEDFNPYSVSARNTTEGTEIVAIPGTDTPPIDVNTSLTGQTVFVGRACGAVAPAGAAKIALVERGDCDFTVKVANIEAAGGYTGVIVFNREGEDGCSTLVTMNVQGNIPAVFVDRLTGFKLLNIENLYNEANCAVGDPLAPLTAVAVGTPGDSVDLRAVFDGWGYVRLFRNGTGKLKELDTFAIPEAFDPAKATGFGDLSVHEVAMSEKQNNLAYFSYYSGGFRVLEIQSSKLVEVGHFIDEGGSNFWGVQVFQVGGKEYVAASDRDFGVYIFEYKPVNP
jgi:hypothetical protein